jgi:hypothetical protein
VNTHHTDEGFLYKITRVLVRKGLIVGFRALITADRQQIEEQTSIHIKDLEEMTKQYISDSAMTVVQNADHMDHAAPIGRSDLFPGRLRTAIEPIPGKEKGQRAVDGRRSSGELRIAKGVPLQARSVLASGVNSDYGSGGSSQTVGASGPTSVRESSRQAGLSDASQHEPISARTADAGQRIRKQRVLSNVAKLGEISAIESTSMGEAVAELNLIGEDNSHILYEPKNYKECLDSPQSREWRGARTREKDSLYKRKVMSWHRASKGAKILKSRYIYKIKRDEYGKVKQFKAKLVVLGCQQEKGTDVEQTFAPVVKGVTIRLIMALAFIMNLMVHEIDISSAFCYADIEEDAYM